MNHRVLLVDDEPRVLAGLQRSLRREPYEIIGVTSGVDALDLMANCVVDAVIADYDMPGMKGTVLLRQVAQQYPETVRFMLTGKPSLDVALQALNQGSVNRFFTKPCDDAELSISIRQALEQRDLMIEAFRLLRRYKRQQARMRRVEQEFPLAAGIVIDDTEMCESNDSVRLTYDHLIEELRSTYGE